MPGPKYWILSIANIGNLTSTVSHSPLTVPSLALACPFLPVGEKGESSSFSRWEKVRMRAFYGNLHCQFAFKTACRNTSVNKQDRLYLERWFYRTGLSTCR